MNRSRRFSPSIAGLLAIVALVVIGVLIVDLTAKPTTPATSATATARVPTIHRAEITATSTFAFPLAAPAPTMEAVAVVGRVGPAVVTVINQQRIAGSGTNQLLEVGSGTGFIIDRAGHVVTNDHVVSGGQAFQVVLADGSNRTAKLIGGDPVSDLAVLQISGPLPGIAILGDSNRVLPGQPVLALGSPLGTYTNTVTRGVVSGINRTVNEETGLPSLTGLIQHDAAVNPGNSGGPLVNLAGQIIGVNTIGIPEQNGTPVQGIFFAIPSTAVQQIVSELIDSGKVVYPFLGVATVPVTVQRNGDSDEPMQGGALVQSIVAGPAKEAGMRQGDVILAINGEQLAAGQPLTQLLFHYAPGDTVKVKVLRGSRQVTLHVTLGERPPK